MIGERILEIEACRFFLRPSDLHSKDITECRVTISENRCPRLAKAHSRLWFNLAQSCLGFPHTEKKIEKQNPPNLLAARKETASFLFPSFLYSSPSKKSPLDILILQWLRVLLLEPFAQTLPARLWRPSRSGLLRLLSLLRELPSLSLLVFRPLFRGGVLRPLTLLVSRRMSMVCHFHRALEFFFVSQSLIEFMQSVRTGPERSCW